MPAGRVLCVTSSLPRWRGDASAPFVLHLAHDLRAAGWEVDVLAPHAPGAAVAETMDGVRIERFRYLVPERLQTVCYGGGALINLRKRPLERLKLPALVAAEWAAVARRLATRRYDVLHSHWILPQGFVGALARGRARHVVTVHGGDLFALRGRLFAAFKRAALTRADAITVNGAYTEKRVRELVPDAKRVVRIPMGVDVDPPSEAVRRAAEELRVRYRVGSGPLVMFAGRLVDEKGVADLIEAIAEVRADLPDTRALILGDGQDREALEAQARALGLADRVTFVGWIERERLPAWLAAADAFVGPSRQSDDGWVEAQGLVFLEAMAAGLPVIATRTGGIPEIVVHEATGLLVGERAPGEIAAALRRLANEPQLAAALADRGRRHAVEHFSRSASARAFAGLFAQLTAGNAVEAGAP